MRGLKRQKSLEAILRLGFVESLGKHRRDNSPRFYRIVGAARLARILPNGGSVNYLSQVYLGAKVDALCHDDLAKKTHRTLDSRSSPCNLACPV